MKYLFVDWNNGHFTTYHPFECELVLSQEKVTEMLLTIPGARRTGTCVEHLMELLDKKGVKVGYWTCKSCKSLVKKIEDPDLKEWIVIEGISGNY